MIGTPADDTVRSKVNISLWFWRLIPPKGYEERHMFLVNTNRTSYTGRSIWHHQIWPWVSFKGQSQDYSYFEGFYVENELSYAIFLKQDTGSPMASIHLTLGDLEKSKARPFRLWRLNTMYISLVKKTLGHMLLLNINRKSYRGNPATALDLTYLIVSSKNQNQGHLDLGVRTGMHIFGSILIWMLHKKMCRWAGFSIVKRSFLFDLRHCIKENYFKVYIIQWPIGVTFYMRHMSYIVIYSVTGR